MALTLDIKSFVAIIFIFLWSRTSRATSRAFYDQSSIAKRHEEWMSSYGRTYEHDEEKAKRREIFKQNLEFIETFNIQGNKTFRLSLNRFVDLTDEEFVAFHTGSCWAFSSVAAIESIIQIKTGELHSLSEQQLVDCASDNGCGGNYMDAGFKYLAQGQRLATELEYPYEARDGTCRDGMVNVARISDYQDVPQGNEEELLKAVANQPVSVAIEGRGQAFRFYTGGLFTGECGTQLTHAVTIIGYGEDTDGKKYWLIRNSWGQDWGEGGYMKILRDTGIPEGLCGINLKVSYPIY